MLPPRISTPLNILLVSDNSPDSTAAMDLVSHITWSPGISVIVLALVPDHLPQMTSPSEGGGALTEAVELVHWRDWAAAKILATGVTRQLQTHHLMVGIEICEGQPSEVAMTRPVDRTAGLIVIGAKGLETPEKVWLVAAVYKLVEQANCSVLVARPLTPVQPLG